MKWLLSRENAGVLEQLAWANVLLAFDFDGTLAPIVVDRDGADMRARTRALFSKLCALYPCAVISGRSRKDVATRVDGSTVRYLVGNHGLEPGGNMRAFEREVAAARPHLEHALAAEAGVEIEDKRYSLAIHYRKSRRKRDARVAIDRAVSTLPFEVRVISGKLVVNVVPRRAPNKGDALLRLRTRQGADTALYVGDDTTDEDVFELDQPGRLVAVRVGQSRSSAATYCLRDQREIDTLLAKLVALRHQLPRR